jgi:hypothetical protein
LLLQDATLSDNTSAGNGGGLEIDTAGANGNTPVLIDDTITGNRALSANGANGGGIDAGAGLTTKLTLLNDTIDGNLATNGGGIFWAAAPGSTVRLQSTIVAANAALAVGPDLANNQATGAYADLGNNLIGIAGVGSGFSTSGAPNTLAGSVANPLNPLLGPLGNNGGPTVGAPGHDMTLQTQAPQAGSFAIGNGNVAAAPANDERGFPSVVNGKANIGAVSPYQVFLQKLIGNP